MTRRMCVVGGCLERRHAQLLCQRHYMRWASGGNPFEPSQQEKTAEDRFWEKVDLDGECWLWTGSLSTSGYGKFWSGERYLPAHHFSLQIVGRTVDAGMQVDHLCRTTQCIRPDHLDVVTPRENTLRSSNPAALNARKDGCGKCGKPYDSTGSKGERACRRCNLDRDNAARRAARARRRSSLVA